MKLTCLDGPQVESWKMNAYFRERTVHSWISYRWKKAEERKSEEVRRKQKRSKRKSFTNSSVTTNDEGAAENEVGQPLVMLSAFYLPCNRLYSQSTSRFVHDAGLYKFRNVAFRRASQPERNPANSIDNCLRLAHSDALNRANSLRWMLRKLIFLNVTFVRQSTWQFPTESTKLDYHSNIAKYFLHI